MWPDLHEFENIIFYTGLHCRVCNGSIIFFSYFQSGDNDFVHNFPVFPLRLSGQMYWWQDRGWARRARSWGRHGRAAGAAAPIAELVEKKNAAERWWLQHRVIAFLQSVLAYPRGWTEKRLTAAVTHCCPWRCRVLRQDGLRLTGWSTN